MVERRLIESQWSLRLCIEIRVWDFICKFKFIIGNNLWVQ